MTKEEAIERLEYVKANAMHQRDAGVSQYWQQEIDGTIEALTLAIEALADRKTENSSEIPNNCEDVPQIFICPIQDNYEALIEDEPQTDCAWK